MSRPIPHTAPGAHRSVGVPRTRSIVFDIHTLTKLMCHYSDGLIPPDAEVRIAGPHKWLRGWWGMVLRSRMWPSGTRMEKPLIYRYEGKRNQVLLRDGWHTSDGPNTHD